MLYGVTPKVANFYTRAHVRQTFHEVLQLIEVTEGIAEMGLKLAMSSRIFALAWRAKRTSQLIGKLSGFKIICVTYFS